MKEKSLKFITIGIATLSLIVSSLALYLSWSLHSKDYEKSVLIDPGALPLVEINEGENSIELGITNTSKSNLQYFLRADTNIGCLKGENSKPKFYPCSYESQIVSVSKASAGKSTYSHNLSLEAVHGAVETHPLAYISNADYYLSISIIDAGNGRTLYTSKCFYAYHVDSKVFVLDQPILDTSGDSEIRQQNCHV